MFSYWIFFCRAWFCLCRNKSFLSRAFISYNSWSSFWGETDFYSYTSRVGDIFLGDLCPNALLWLFLSPAIRLGFSEVLKGLRELSSSNCISFLSSSTPFFFFYNCLLFYYCLFFWYYLLFYDLSFFFYYYCYFCCYFTSAAGSYVGSLDPRVLSQHPNFISS